MQIAEIGADIPIKCVGGQNIYFTSDKSLWDAGGGGARARVGGGGARGAGGVGGGGGGVEERGRGQGALVCGLLSGKYVVPVRGLPPAASRGGGAGGGGEEEQSQLKGGREYQPGAPRPAPARAPPPATTLPECSMVCGGASHEHGHPADLLTRVPRLDQAITSLLPELSDIYSPLADPTKWTPVASVYGVRALAPRQQEGRIPFAGRVTSTHSAYTRLSPPPPGGLWIFTGLGSRGLIHHSILAEHLATAILENDASKLPGDVRQIALLREEDSNPQT